MYLRRRSAALAVLALFAVSACSQADNGNNTLTDDPVVSTTASASPTGGGDKPAETDKIEAKDNEFVPKSIAAKAGDITLTMDNTGAAPHTFTQTELKVDVNADAGKTVKITIKGAKAGTYKFVCKYHESIGMVGELTVT